MSEPSRVDDFARSLRDESPELDDVARARMEREVLRQRAPAAPRSRTPVFVAGLAVGAVAAGVLAWVLLGPAQPIENPEVADGASSPEPATAPAAGTIAFEALADGVPVRSGRLRDGETVQTTAGQLVRTRFGGPSGETALVEVSPESRVRYVWATGDDIEISLERGVIRVEFHPVRRGEESLAVRTPHGRVEVVGTAFEVRLAADGTEVRVEEGTVRLVGLDGETRLVSRGERAWLRAVVAALGTMGPPPAADDGSAAGEAAAREAAAREAAAGEAEGLEANAAEVVETPRPRRPIPDLEPTLDDELRFDLADRYFAQGRFEAARHELYAITRSGETRGARARAWVRVAEAFVREGEPQRAAEAYRRASRIGSADGEAALFALARLLADEGDAPGAVAAYRRYLDTAPAGPLASEARRGLCGLGDAASCR